MRGKLILVRNGIEYNVSNISKLSTITVSFSQINYSALNFYIIRLIKVGVSIFDQWNLHLFSSIIWYNNVILIIDQSLHGLIVFVSGVWIPTW